jgi:hypothetical protein
MTNDIFQKVSIALLTTIGSIGLYIFSGFGKTLSDIEASVNKLNVNVIQIITRQENQKELNDFFRKRLDALETGTKNHWTLDDHKDFARRIDSRFDVLIRTYEKRFNRIEQERSK